MMQIGRIYADDILLINKIKSAVIRLICVICVLFYLSDIPEKPVFPCILCTFVCAVCSEIVSLHKFVRKRIKKIRYA